jgi:hypothetical protein
MGNDAAGDEGCMPSCRLRFKSNGRDKETFLQHVEVDFGTPKLGLPPWQGRSLERTL